jgi:hypothetical protein
MRLEGWQLGVTTLNQLPLPEFSLSIIPFAKIKNSCAANPRLRPSFEPGKRG